MTGAPRCLRPGRVDYTRTWNHMRAFTTARGVETPDELWFLEHPPVYTLGRNAAPAHLLDPGGIPVLRVDRGGQVTYHGPGQLVVYTLLDLHRLGLGVRAVVSALEGAVIDLLAERGITGRARPDAPGVYVDGAKIAALGLRVRRGCSYHGLALNVDMDLGPFAGIDPCGYRGLPVTQLRDLGVDLAPEAAADALQVHLVARLGYTVPSPGARVRHPPGHPDQEHGRPSP